MRPIAWREGKYPQLLKFSGYMYGAVRIGGIVLYVEWRRGIGVDMGVEQ